MNGFKTDANFAQNDGSCETIGVTRLRSPKAAIITTIAYGDQMHVHSETFVIATFAMRTSALSAFSSWRGRLIELDENYKYF